MENNLKIYENLREVPKEAQNKIKGGRLSGMTDIKPMWRIEKLTETFGPAGLGWYTKTIDKSIIDGANDTKIATVDIQLFVNYKFIYGEGCDVWSQPIEGSGGSSFVAKEKNGLYTNDECFKMAYTDALSVACRSLGMGANVYWGDSKYSNNEPTLEEAEKYVIGFGKYQGELLTEVIKDEWYKNYLLNGNDDYIKKCIELLTGEKALSESEQQESLKLLGELNRLFNETGIDRENMYKHYNVESDSQMTSEQMKDAIKKLKTKLNEQN